MEYHIWRELILIWSYRNDLIDTIKSFFVQLSNNNNEIFNINEEKHIPFLQSLSEYQLDLLHKAEIINEEIYKALEPKENHFSTNPSINEEVREIIQGDKMEEFKSLIQKKGISTISPISKSFNEVPKMGIPIISECIIQKATKCFKYLLINGIEDPKIPMEEQNPYSEEDLLHEYWQSQRQYDWDSMAIAIFYGEVEIIKILEDKGIEKGTNPSHIEAAILSYQNGIVNEIINNLKEKNEEVKNQILDIGLIAAAKNNNIKGAELLLGNEVNVNAKDIINQIIEILFLIKRI